MFTIVEEKNMGQKFNASMKSSGVEYQSQTKSTNKVKTNPVNNSTEPSVVRKTEIINIQNYQPAEFQDFLKCIRKVKTTDLISTILICTFILSAVPVFIVTGVIGVVLKVLVCTKLRIQMEYSFDDESKKDYENLCQIWMSLNKNIKFWQIITEQTTRSKTSGGANRSITRIPAKAITKLPIYLKSNVNPFGLKLKGKKVYFLPDKLLIISGTKVGSISYSEMKLVLGTTQFIETESVPKDAVKVGETWLKVNKDGTPDKRFNKNRKVPICRYGKIVTKSQSGDFNVELMCSNCSVIDQMTSFSNILKNSVYPL